MNGLEVVIRGNHLIVVLPFGKTATLVQTQVGSHGTVDCLDVRKLLVFKVEGEEQKYVEHWADSILGTEPVNTMALEHRPLTEVDRSHHVVIGASVDPRSPGL